MTLEQLKETVRELIKKAKQEAAIKELATWAHRNNDEKLKDAAIMASSRLSSLNNKVNLGHISEVEATLQLNLITSYIMSIITDLGVPTEVKTIEKESKPSNPKHPLSIFISYSKSDKDMMESFRKYLKPLERKGLITTWADTNLKAGEDWEQAIEHQLTTADIIVFLVSSDLINTDYIWDVEMPIAFQRHQNGAAKIVPIILRDCGWQDTDFAQLNALPEKGRPVTTYRTQDDAWFYVYEKLKELLT